MNCFVLVNLSNVPVNILDIFENSYKFGGLRVLG
jgi:hypothetical protein